MNAGFKKRNKPWLTIEEESFLLKPIKTKKNENEKKITR